MLKTTLIAAGLFAALLTPALAADATCDEASLKMAEEQVYKMQDQKAKNDAMSQIYKARMAMKDNKMEECMTHVTELNIHLKKT